VTLKDGRSFRAAKTVVTAGVWSREIGGIPELKRASLRPVRGQMVALAGDASATLSHVVRSPDVYMIPRYDGTLLIGSTMEERGFDSALTAGGVRNLLQEAWRIMPGIDELTIKEMWTGFRPATLDGRPIIGPSSLPGLFLATGHGRHGILLASATAERVVAQLAGSAGGEISAFDPRRFSTRAARM